MKVNFTKQPGGVLTPSDDVTAEFMTSLKTGEIYEVEIKRSRNPKFHSKMFAFFNFCFDHWRGDAEFQCEKSQREHMRKQLTVLAGYYEQVFNLDGSFELVARSLSFASMDQSEFEACSVAIQNAAMATIFKNADDKTVQQLYGFF